MARCCSSPIFAKSQSLIVETKSLLYKFCTLVSATLQDNCIFHVSSYLLCFGSICTARRRHRYCSDYSYLGIYSMVDKIKQNKFQIDLISGKIGICSHYERRSGVRERAWRRSTNWEYRSPNASPKSNPHSPCRCSETLFDQGGSVVLFT